MILPGKSALIHILAAEIGRITVKEGIRAVIMADQHFKVLILDDGVLHPDAEILDQPEQAPDGEGLAGEALS